MALVLLPAVSTAHTVAGRIVEAKPAVVEFRYSSGEPMAYAEVAVIGPTGSEPYQTGRADALGRFAFVADRSGSWRVEARDEERHVARVALDLSDALVVRRPLQRLIDVALLVSLCLNAVAGIKIWQASSSTRAR
jgi:hypothetical protein